MKKRMVPRSSIQEHCNNMSASRIVSTRAMNVPNINVSKNNPFNPKINEPVRNNVLVTANLKKPAPVKNQKLAPGNNNTALYAIRHNAVGDAEKTYLEQSLNNSANERVELLAKARAYAYTPAEGAYNIARVGDTQVSLRSDRYMPKKTSYKTIEAYNPMLPESETNIKPEGLPLIVDERIEQTRDERPFLYDSGKEELALRLHNDPERKKRMQAQADAYNAFYNVNMRNRWGFDEKKQYLERYNDTQFTNTSNVIRKDDDRMHVEPVVSETREAFNSNALDANVQMVSELIENRKRMHGDDIRNAEETYRRLANQHKQVGYREAFEEKEQTGFFEGVINTVSGAVNRLFGVKRQESYKPSVEAREVNSKRDIEDLLLSEHFQQYTKHNGTHVKVVASRDWDSPLIMDPVDEYSNVAAGILSLDESKTTDEFRIKKSVAFMQDGKFIIVQQYEKDKILGNDLNPVNDDLVVTVIPEENLDKDFRTHISTLNPYIEQRAKPLNLTYEDYVQVINWIEANPDMQDRMTVKMVVDSLRGFDYDRDMQNSFDKDSTMFIETAVKDKLVETIRTKLQEKMKQRITPASVTAENTFNEGSKANFKSRTDHPVNVNHSTQRSKALSKNPFN